VNADELTRQWRGWIEKNIDGPEGRIESALQAAVAAINHGKSSDEIVAAARQAGARWTGPIPRSARPASIARNRIRGRVAGLQQRQEMDRLALTPGRMNPPYSQVWSFRIQQVDQDGAVLPAVAVQMRGSTFRGYLAEGDEVEVYAPNYRPGSTVHPSQVHNLSANSVVRAQSWPPSRVFRWLALVIVILFLVVAVASVRNKL
jgi:hypothetical protein